MPSLEDVIYPSEINSSRSSYDLNHQGLPKCSTLYYFHRVNMINFLLVTENDTSEVLSFKNCNDGRENGTSTVIIGEMITFNPTNEYYM